MKGNHYGGFSEPYSTKQPLFKARGSFDVDALVLKANFMLPAYAQLFLTAVLMLGIPLPFLYHLKENVSFYTTTSHVKLLTMAMSSTVDCSCAGRGDSQLIVWHVRENVAPLGVVVGEQHSSVSVSSCATSEWVTFISMQRVGQKGVPPPLIAVNPENLYVLLKSWSRSGGHHYSESCLFLPLPLHCLQCKTNRTGERGGSPSP